MAVATKPKKATTAKTSQKGDATRNYHFTAMVGTATLFEGPCTGAKLEAQIKKWLTEARRMEADNPQITLRASPTRK